MYVWSFRSDSICNSLFAILCLPMIDSMRALVQTSMYPEHLKEGSKCSTYRKHTSGHAELPVCGSLAVRAEFYRGPVELYPHQLYLFMLLNIHTRGVARGDSGGSDEPPFLYTNLCTTVEICMYAPRILACAISACVPT